MNYKLLASDKDDDLDDDDKESPFDHDAENEHMDKMEKDDEDEEGVDADHEEDEEAEQAKADGRRVAHPEDEEEDEDGEPKQRKGESKPEFQKRIDRLTARAKGAEEERDDLRERLSNAERDRDEAREFGSTASLENVKAEEATITAKLEAAIEAGDTKTQVKLQSELSTIAAKKLAMENYQSRVKRQKEAGGADDGGKQAEAPVGRARFKPAARPWYDRNKTWFDAPERTIERAAVQALDAELTAEGYKVDEEERYVELDKRLAAKFPDLYRKGEKRDSGKRPGGRQRVAGADRESTGAGRGADRGGDGGKMRTLSDDDKRTMRRFRLDPANADHVKEFRRQQRNS